MSIRRFASLLAVIVAAAVGAPTAHAATSTRTFVSNVGTNNSECSVTSPCLTFTQAIAATSNGGEIDCLTPGGFGPVTISISVTIDCEDASNGGITVGGNDNAININTAGTLVTLIGLDINGENQAGSFGVNISAAATVNVRNCKIYGFSNVALNFSASGGTLVADNVFASDSYVGIGIYSAGSLNMTVRNSTISNNGNGIIVQNATGTHVGATIEQTTLAFNQYGLYTISAGAVAVIGGSTVVNNGTGIINGGGTVYSFKNNQIGGNGTDGTPLTAYPGGPLN